MPIPVFSSFAALAMRNVCQWRNLGLTEKDWIYGQPSPQLSLQEKIQKTVRVILSEIAFLGVSLIATTELFFITFIVGVQAVTRFVLPIRQEEREFWISGMKESLFITAWALYDALFGNLYFPVLASEVAFARGIAGLGYRDTPHHEYVIAYWNQHGDPFLREEGSRLELARQLLIPIEGPPEPPRGVAPNPGALLNPGNEELPPRDRVEGPPEPPRGVAPNPGALLNPGNGELPPRDRDIETGVRLLMDVIFKHVVGDRTVDDEATIDLVLDADVRIYRFITARAAFEYAWGLRRGDFPSVFRAVEGANRSIAQLRLLRTRAATEEQIESIRQKLVSVEAFEAEVGERFIGRALFLKLLGIASIEAHGNEGILIRECMQRAAQIIVQRRALRQMPGVDPIPEEGRVFNREERIIRWDPRTLLSRVDASVRQLHGRVDRVLGSFGVDVIDRAWVITILVLSILPLLGEISRHPPSMGLSIAVFDHQIRAEKVFIQGVLMTTVAVLLRLVYLSHSEARRNRLVFG